MGVVDMPSIEHGTQAFTISPGATLIITTRFSNGPNRGPVWSLADPDSGQAVPALLITFDHSKNRDAPPPGGPGGPGTHEVFYRCKVRSESTQNVSFHMERFLPQ
jgi:hypothetical protein